MKRLSMIHTAPLVVDILKRLLGERYPELESFHMVDESLIQDARRHSGMAPATVRRVAGLCGLSRDAGAEVILFTCSTTSPAVDSVRPLFDIPILKIDDPMAAKAVESARRIGLLCTSRTTVQPSEALLRYHADRKGHEVDITTVVEAEAYFALRDGDQKKHDRSVCAAASKLAQNCDVIVLAQASMEHLASEIFEMTSVPVFSSPKICVESLAEVLTN